MNATIPKVDNERTRAAYSGDIYEYRPSLGRGQKGPRCICPEQATPREDGPEVKSHQWRKNGAVLYATSPPSPARFPFDAGPA